MGAVCCTITWTLRNKESNTRLFFTIDYRVPIPVLGWLAEKTVIKMNENEADLLMANIQTRLEEENHLSRDLHNIPVVQMVNKN